MTETNGAQLLVEGLQDVWLTSEPQMSFFRSTYKRHVPFGMSLERIDVRPGGLVRFDTSKGDMLGYVYMTKHDPVTGRHVPTPVTFTVMYTRIGEQVIDTRDLTYLNTIRLAVETRNESQAKTPDGFQPLWLPFSGSYFPLVALRAAQLDLVFEGLDGAFTYKVWAEFIHLPYEERYWMEMQTHRIPIQQVRRFVPINGDVCLAGPVKYIAWPTFNYTSEVMQEYQPVVVNPGVTIVNTLSANTFTVTQSTDFYGQTTLQWTTSTLPSGVTIQSTTNNAITFALASTTAVTVQAFDVTVTTPYGKRSTTRFLFGANPITDFYDVSNYLGTAYNINNIGNPVLFAKRLSIVVFRVTASGYPFVVQTVAAPYSAGDVYTDGFTHAGVDSGTIIWEVSSLAPLTLYYVAQNTPAMTNVINVSS